ncbi:MAG: TonB-dependent receptor [Bacteroidota bacterium]|nr:TonB-dependent receptor [Bacteroidota bacterium]
MIQDSPASPALPRGRLREARRAIDDSRFTILVLIFVLFCFTSNVFSQDKNESDSMIFKTESIDVDALKGIERFTPVAFENIKRDAIERKYWMQDLPMFLNGYTGINSYSESGASIGYSYLSLRGFDQKRISILINGVPQNDPEDHQVYWVDISDLTASVEEIQIQRGIGTALYGSSSVGGVINIKTIDLFKRKFLNLSGGYGNFNSKRFSLEYSSGLVDKGFGFYGKFTKTNSDGYRDMSWSDHWSYFLSAGKLIGKNSTLKLNVYGSPIKNHLAYLGVDKVYLDGKITGDKFADRKYNYLTYPDETDNYFQPHYEMVYNIQTSKNIFVSNTISYIRGEGFFNTSFPVSYGYNFDYFRLNPFYVSDTTTFDPLYYRRNPDGTFYFSPAKGYEITRSNIVAKLTVNNNTLGWFPRAQIEHDNNRGTFVAGGELRYHRSDHFGEVTFGDALPQGTPPGHQYYFYNGGKRTYSIYANEIYSFTKKLNAMAGVQYVHHRYNLSNDKFKPYDFSVNYNFITPRLGVNYNFDDKLSAFVNFSIARREPRLKDIYNAEDPVSRPNFRVIDTTKGIYEDPLVRPEEMFDYEAGIGYKSDKIKADLNFYVMDFKDEIVNNGQLDNVGQPIVGNAAKSIHRGIELGMEIKPFVGKIMQGVSFSGNLNLSQNYFKEYVEINGVDSTGNIIYGNNYSENKILLTPDIIGNLSLNYFQKGFGAHISLHHIGRQYLDNSENERKNPGFKNDPQYIDKIIEPYTVVNAGLSFNIASVLDQKLFKNLELSFKANNIFDVLYETSGNISFGVPYWIPAATRNFFGELKVGF